MDEAPGISRDPDGMCRKGNEDPYYQYLCDFPGIAYRSDMALKPLFILGSVTKITGYSTEEVFDGNPSLHQLIQPDDLLDIMERNDMEMICSVPNHSMEREYRIVRKDGEIRWVREVLRNQCNDRGEPEFIQGTIFEEHDRRCTEEMMKVRYCEMLEHSNEVKTAYDGLQRSHDNLMHSGRISSIASLTSALAHEINNPLQVIMGMAEIILDEEELTTAKEHTGEILAAADRIKSVVHGLSFYTGESKGLDIELIDLNEVIEDCVDMMKYSPKFPRVRLRMELGDIPMIIATQGEMHQIFINIFINAISAMDDEGCLSVVSEELNDEIRIEISDDGKGIGERELKHIYDPFTMREKGMGTGLGIFMVRQIVEKYGGGIDISSTPGKGTKVTITFQIPVDEEV